MPRVSACIATYNSEEFIKEGIESILAQTYSDFELIICDDCSKDNTANIVKSFKDSRIKFFINKANIGWVNNFNRCIELANGEFITILGGDDVMIAGNLERKVKFLEGNPNIGLVHSNIYMINEHGKKIRGHFAKNPAEDTIIDGFTCFKKLILGHNFICAPSVFLRKECHDKLGKYDSRLIFAADYEMWARISLYYNIGYIVESLIKYRWHQQNVSRDFQGPNRLKGEKQNYLCKMIMLENYYKIPHRAKMKKGELDDVYWEMGYFYFSQNDMKRTRKIFLDSLEHSSFKLRVILYYLCSFLPVRGIKIVKYFKRLQRTLVENKKTRAKPG